ncbi:hypothetical protein D7I45_04040 [Apilactobacillus bombintestini]|uniref:YhaN AAA domain-containing protein n=2 Tax=Apilactobacillus bombintestini TaxID=2419772 RepID=A0A387AVK6_9LACO|nr:hypothetical protein D7I45_04040 [Apilactobacillus bombintestini]
MDKMKINKLDVLGYGKWHDVSFDFTKDNLQIIFGNNEAGKTTLLSLIEGIIFGFVDGRGSGYEQYIPKDTSSYGGKLTITTEENRHFILTRVAGTHGGDLTIYDIDNDMTTDNGILKKILGPIDRNTFENLFYFGDLDIKAISKLSKNELVSRIQKVGFVGSDEWISLRDDLEKKSKELYAPTGRKPPLNVLLKDYDNLLNQIEQSKGNLDKYNELQNKHSEINEELRSMKQQVAKLDKEIQKTKHLSQLWPIFEKINTFDSVKNMDVKKGFAEDDDKKLNDLKNQLFLVNKQLASVDADINALQNQISNSKLLDEFNSNKSRIDKLVQDFSNINDLINQLNVKISMIDELENQQSETTVADENDLENIRSLWNSYNQVSENTSNSNFTIISILAMIIGFGLVIFTPVMFKICGAVLFVIAAIYLYYLKKNAQKTTQKQEIASELQNNLSKYGVNIDEVSEWLSEQNYLKKHVNDTQTLDSYEKDVEQYKNQLNQYFDEWKHLVIDLNRSVSYDKQLENIKQYVSKMNDLNMNSLRINKQIQEQLAKKKELSDQKNTLSNEVSTFLKERNLSSIDDFVKESKVQKNIEENKKELSNFKSQISDDEIKQLQSYENVDQLNKKIADFTGQYDNLRKQILDLSQQLETINIQLQHYINDGTYNELLQNKSNQEAEIESMVDQWMSMKLSSQWIDEALNIATADRIPLFEKKAKEFFGILTNQRYTKITYYKSKLKVTRNDKLQFDAGELSRGTIEQLYLSLILSLSVVFGRSYQLPIIIDDGLTEFDSNRTKNAVNLLNKLSDNLQVIYTTCDDGIPNLVDKNDVLNLNEY